MRGILGTIAWLVIIACVVLLICGQLLAIIASHPIIILIILAAVITAVRFRKISNDIPSTTLNANTARTMRIHRMVFKKNRKIMRHWHDMHR